MSQLVLKVNKKQTNIQQNNFFSYEGKFNYYVEVEINGQIQETTSEINIQIYQSNDKKYTMSCNLNWFTEKDNFQTKLNCNNRKISVSALQYDTKIVCKITPAEQGFFGECRIFYGPIKLNNKLFNEYQNIKKQDFLEIDVEGISLTNMINFATIEIRNNSIITHDQNFQTVNDLKISSNLQIDDQSQNCLQIKVNQSPSNLGILDIKFTNKNDKDIFLLLLNDKIKKNRNNFQNFGKQYEQKLTTQIQDLSIVKNNGQNNHSISSLRSINQMFKGRNPLQVRVNDTHGSQRSLSYQIFSNQKSQRNISQTRNPQNQFSVEQDQIVNKYLTNKQQQIEPGSFGKISFQQQNLKKDESKLKIFDNSAQQQNYFQVDESFDKKFDQKMKFQKEINLNIEISQERITNVKLNDQNQNLQKQNQNFLKTIQRLQITNEGLQRELDFVKLQKQKNEEQESILKDQKEIVMRKQYQVLNDKYKISKQKLLEFETKIEEVQKRLLNTQNSLMETENQKFLIQNQFREFKEENQQIWEKMQILQKENQILKDDLNELDLLKNQKIQVDDEIKEKVELVQNLQNTIKMLNQQNNLMKEEHEDLIRDLTFKDQKILTLQQKNQDFQNLQDQLRKNKKDLIEQLQEYKIKQQEQKQEIHELTNFNQYEEKFILEKKTNEMLNLKLNDKKNELINLEQKFELLKLQKDQLQNELDKIQISNLENQNDQENYYKMYQKLKAENNNLKRDFNLLKQEKEILEEDIKEKRNDIQKYKIIQSENEEMIENLNRNINLKTQNEIQEEKEIQRNLLLSKLEVENGQEQMYLNLQDNMSKLREDIFYLREEKFENLEKIQKLQHDLNIKEEDLCKLNQQLNLKKIELQNFQCKIDQQDLELSQMQQKLMTNKKQMKKSFEFQGQKMEMEEILQQKEKQISYLRQKNKQFEQKLKNKNVFEQLKLKDSQINSMQFELNKKTQKIDNLLTILRHNQNNQNFKQNSQIIKKIKLHAEKLENENEQLKIQLQKINSQQRYGDSMNILGNIEIEDIKEQLLRLLELYEEDLRYEYELLDMEDIILKLKEIIFDLKKAKKQLEEKDLLLEETNKLLLNYEDEKIDENSLLDTEIYYDQIIYNLMQEYQIVLLTTMSIFLFALSIFGTYYFSNKEINFIQKMFLIITLYVSFNSIPLILYDIRQVFQKGLQT